MKKAAFARLIEKPSSPSEAASVHAISTTNEDSSKIGNKPQQKEIEAQPRETRLTRTKRTDDEWMNEWT